MKIKVTEVECTAEELRQSNSISDGFMNLVRNLLNGSITEENDTDNEEYTDKEQT